MVHDGEDPTWFGEVFMKTINVKPEPDSWSQWNGIPPNEWFNLGYENEKLNLDIEFPSECYRVSDWGSITYLNNSIYVVGLEIEKFNGACTQAIKTVSHEYSVSSDIVGKTLLLYNNGMLFGTAIVSETITTAGESPTPSIPVDPVNPEVVEPMVFGLIPTSWLWIATILFLIAGVVTRNDHRFYEYVYIDSLKITKVERKR